MQNNALRKASDLEPPVRAAFESVLGRSLQDHETVSVNAYQPGPAPTGQAREDAYRRLLDSADKLAQRVKNVPDEEIDAAIDEAVDKIRHDPE